MNQAEARRYVYQMLAASLSEDIDNAGYIHEDVDEFDKRRVIKAATSILRDFRKRAAGPTEKK